MSIVDVRNEMTEGLAETLSSFDKEKRARELVEATNLNVKDDNHEDSLLDLTKDNTLNIFF